MPLLYFLLPVYFFISVYIFQSGEELMLIPGEEEKPAVTLKMSKSEIEDDKENSENFSRAVKS